MIDDPLSKWWANCHSTRRVGTESEWVSIPDEWMGSSPGSPPEPSHEHEGIGFGFGMVALVHQENGERLFSLHHFLSHTLLPYLGINWVPTFKS